MRKKRNYKRERKPDFKFGNVAIGRFINYLMEDGKKAVAEKVMYGALEIIKEKSKGDPVAVIGIHIGLDLEDEAGHFVVARRHMGLGVRPPRGHELWGGGEGAALRHGGDLTRSAHPPPCR